MQYEYDYRGRSSLRDTRGGRELQLSPNLARDAVSFHGELRDPLRFREAISTLHHVVAQDLTFQRRDKTAWQRWQADEARQLAQLQQAALDDDPQAWQFFQQHTAAVAEYRQLQTQLRRELIRSERPQWITLLDPVVNVADDVVTFELFSRDESSYARLTCDTDAAFASTGDVLPGTTNVDYSLELYEHFQTLRSYRSTRLSIESSGLAAETCEDIQHGGGNWLRQEKIDLPNSWLAGFLHVQAAMLLTGARVSLSVEALYSLLAWLKRHRARTSPRAIRFELTPGAFPRLVLEPWEQVIESRAALFNGDQPRTIRLWGARRLLTLARALPLVDSVDVHLLETGLPSFWVLKMRELRLTLGLSGWTSNDWTGAAALDAIFPPQELQAEHAELVAERLRFLRRGTLEELVPENAAPTENGQNQTAAALLQLARAGQAIYDLDAGVFRWRQILPAPFDWQQFETDNPERAAAERLLRERQVKITARTRTETDWHITGLSGGRDVELHVNADGRLLRGQCNCSYHFRNGLRRGPCRHLRALHQVNAAAERSTPLLARWWQSLTTKRR